MPASDIPNLTRAQAQSRADLLHVDSYDITLDLTDGGGKPGDRTFRSVTRVRFDCNRPARPPSSTYRRPVPLGYPQRHRRGRVRLPQRRRPRAGRPGRRQRARGRRRPALHQHRRGPAPLRRPARRRGLPLLAVRDRRRQAHVRLLRPARPEGGLHVTGHRARPLGGLVQRRRRSRREQRRAGKRPLRHHAADEPVHHRAGRRAVPRRARPTTTARRHPSACGAAGRWPRTWTPPSCSRSPGRASTGTTRTSACGTRSASTTSSSSPSSTRARWRTPAA